MAVSTSGRRPLTTPGSISITLDLTKGVGCVACCSGSVVGNEYMVVLGEIIGVVDCWEFDGPDVAGSGGTDRETSGTFEVDTFCRGKERYIVEHGKLRSRHEKRWPIEARERMWKNIVLLSRSAIGVTSRKLC